MVSLRLLLSGHIFQRTLHTYNLMVSGQNPTWQNPTIWKVEGGSSVESYCNFLWESQHELWKLVNYMYNNYYTTQLHNWLNPADTKISKTQTQLQQQLGDCNCVWFEFHRPHIWLGQHLTHRNCWKWKRQVKAVFLGLNLMPCGSWQ